MRLPHSDWEWWGKFDGADANIADKVYIIDMDSVKHKLRRF